MAQCTGKRKFKAIAFGLVGMFPLFSIAQQNDELWLKCAEVVDPSNRLACFDSVANNTLKNMTETKPESHISGDVPIPTQTANTESSTPPTHAAENRQLLAEVGVTENILEEYTPLSRLYDLDSNDGYGLLTLRAHNPNYIMPIWHNSKRNKTPHTPSQPRDLLYDGKANSTETKFQISFKTKIWWAFCIVARRWAIINTVLPLKSRSNACCISVSLSASVNAVASSNTTMGESFKIARAIAMRCASPPDKCLPPSPSIVSYPCGKLMIKSWHIAALAAVSTSARLTLRFMAMFSCTVLGNKKVS